MANGYPGGNRIGLLPLASRNEPELEGLLRALYERDTCEPADLVRRRATANRLIEDALSRRPGLSRDEFMDAIRPRYAEYRAKQRKPFTLPPKA